MSSATPLPRGIRVHGNRFRVEPMVRGKRIRRSFDTVEEAQAFLARIEADVADAKSVKMARI